MKQTNNTTREIIKAYVILLLFLSAILFGFKYAVDDFKRDLILDIESSFAEIDSLVNELHREREATDELLEFLIEVEEEEKPE